MALLIVVRTTHTSAINQFCATHSIILAYVILVLLLKGVAR